MSLAKCQVAKCRSLSAGRQNVSCGLSTIKNAGHSVPDGKVQKVVKQTSRCVPNCKVQVVGREVAQCKLRSASGEAMLMACPCCKCMLLSLSGLNECVRTWKCALWSADPSTLERVRTRKRLKLNNIEGQLGHSLRNLANTLAIQPSGHLATYPNG